MISGGCQIMKTGHRFSEKIMLNQQGRFEEKSSSKAYQA
jgi:hypothetical protein